MAKPVKYSHTNVAWYGDGDTGALPAYRDDKGSTSCWELSEEELAEVNLTGKVWLTVWGAWHPSVYIDGKFPFEEDEEENKVMTHDVD